MPLCACGCGHATAGGQWISGHNFRGARSESERAILFWSRVERAGPNDCWNWKASYAKHRYGYGVMSWNGRPLTSHRIAYQLTHGPIGDGMSVLHLCDNPACCNPAHLREGSQSENMRDAAIRHRMPSDTAHHFARTIEFDGQRHTVAEWSRQLQISHHALRYRLKRGWTIEEAFTTKASARGQRRHR